MKLSACFGIGSFFVANLTGELLEIRAERDTVRLVLHFLVDQMGRKLSGGGRG